MNERGSPRIRPASRPVRPLGELFLVILVVVLPVLAWSTFAADQSFAANHESAVGTVVESKVPYVGSNGPIAPLTTVDFVTSAGRTMRVDIANESEPVGKSVTVYYSVADPSYARLSEGHDIGTFVAIVMCIFLWLIIMGRFTGKLIAAHRGR